MFPANLFPLWKEGLDKYGYIFNYIYLFCLLCVCVRVCARACTHMPCCTCESHSTTSCRSPFPPSAVRASGLELSSPVDDKHLYPLNHLTSTDLLFKHILYSAFTLILKSNTLILNWNACLYSIELWGIGVFV